MSDTLLLDTRSAESLHKHLRLRVAAYACHEQARGRIAGAMRTTQLAASRLHFNAYFCDRPAVWPFACEEPPPELMAPFVDREIVRRTLSLNIAPDAPEFACESYLHAVREAISAFYSGRPFRIPLAYTNPEAIVQMWQRFAYLGPISSGRMANDLFNAWRADRSCCRWTIIHHAFLARHCVEDMSDKLSSSVLSVAHKMAYVNLFALLYSGLMTSSNDDDCLYFVATPLCTRLTFYGVLIAVVETPAGACRDFASVGPVLDDLGKALMDEARDTYLPTLILSQNSWEEHVLSTYIDATEHSPSRSESASTGLDLCGERMQLFDSSTDRVYSRMAELAAEPPALKPDDENEALEAALIRLWARRRSASQTSVRVVKESLIFQKMMVASPGMITAIRQVAALGLDEPKEAPLQAVLVVAPPGSGKEMMSRLIPLFSSYFWEKPVIPINMGSVLLETRERGAGLLGLLEQLANGPLAHGGTVVLDELNSLDIAVQPMLLRVLEEGAVYCPFSMPTLSARPAEFASNSPGNAASPAPTTRGTSLPWLVVGLINEDPSRLTLEAVREKVTEPIFGDLLGSALYEHWKAKSRLRDDLYYRVRRCGEVRMSGLNDRRPDIPIVFYFRLRKLLRHEVFLTYEALHRLIDASLDWKGNMRKLEAVARQLKGATERDRSSETITRIDDVDIEKGIRAVGMRKGVCATCGQQIDSIASKEVGGG